MNKPSLTTSNSSQQLSKLAAAPKPLPRTVFTKPESKSKSSSGNNASKSCNKPNSSTHSYTASSNRYAQKDLKKNSHSGSDLKPKDSFQNIAKDKEKHVKEKETHFSGAQVNSKPNIKKINSPPEKNFSETKIINTKKEKDTKSISKSSSSTDTSGEISRKKDVSSNTVSNFKNEPHTPVHTTAVNDSSRKTVLNSGKTTEPSRIKESQTSTSGSKLSTEFSKKSENKNISPNTPNPHELNIEGNPKQSSSNNPNIPKIKSGFSTEDPKPSNKRLYPTVPIIEMENNLEHEVTPNISSKSKPVKKYGITNVTKRADKTSSNLTKLYATQLSENSRPEAASTSTNTPSNNSILTDSNKLENHTNERDSNIPITSSTNSVTSPTASNKNAFKLSSSIANFSQKLGIGPLRKYTKNMNSKKPSRSSHVSPDNIIDEIGRYPDRNPASDEASHENRLSSTGAVSRRSNGRSTADNREPPRVSHNSRSTTHANRNDLSTSRYQENRRSAPVSRNDRPARVFRITSPRNRTRQDNQPSSNSGGDTRNQSRSRVQNNNRENQNRNSDTSHPTPSLIGATSLSTPLTQNCYSSKKLKIQLKNLEDFNKAYDKIKEVLKNGRELLLCGNYVQASRDFEIGLKLMDRVLEVSVDQLQLSTLNDALCKSIQDVIGTERKSALEGYSDAQAGILHPKEIPESPPEGAPPSYTEVLKQDLQNTFAGARHSPGTTFSNGLFYERSPSYHQEDSSVLPTSPPSFLPQPSMTNPSHTDGFLFDRVDTHRAPSQRSTFHRDFSLNENAIPSNVERHSSFPVPEYSRHPSAPELLEEDILLSGPILVPSSSIFHAEPEAFAIADDILGSIYLGQRIEQQSTDTNTSVTQAYSNVTLGNQLTNQFHHGPSAPQEQISHSASNSSFSVEIPNADNNDIKRIPTNPVKHKDKNNESDFENVSQDLIQISNSSSEPWAIEMETSGEMSTQDTTPSCKESFDQESDDLILFSASTEKSLFKKCDSYKKNKVGTPNISTLKVHPTSEVQEKCPLKKKDSLDPPITPVTTISPNNVITSFTSDSANISQHNHSSITSPLISLISTRNSLTEGNEELQSVPGNKVPTSPQNLPAPNIPNLLGPTPFPSHFEAPKGPMPARKVDFPPDVFLGDVKPENGAIETSKSTVTNHKDGYCLLWDEEKNTDKKKNSEGVAENKPKSFPIPSKRTNFQTNSEANSIYINNDVISPSSKQVQEEKLAEKEVLENPEPETNENGQLLNNGENNCKFSEENIYENIDTIRSYLSAEAKEVSKPNNNLEILKNEESQTHKIFSENSLKRSYENSLKLISTENNPSVTYENLPNITIQTPLSPQNGQDANKSEVTDSQPISLKDTEFFSHSTQDDLKRSNVKETTLNRFSKSYSSSNLSLSTNSAIPPSSIYQNLEDFQSSTLSVDNNAKQETRGSNEYVLFRDKYLYASTKSSTGVELRNHENSYYLPMSGKIFRKSMSTEDVLNMYVDISIPPPLSPQRKSVLSEFDPLKCNNQSYKSNTGNEDEESSDTEDESNFVNEKALQIQMTECKFGINPELEEKPASSYNVNTNITPKTSPSFIRVRSMSEKVSSPDLDLPPEKDDNTSLKGCYPSLQEQLTQTTNKPDGKPLSPPKETFSRFEMGLKRSIKSLSSLTLSSISSKPARQKKLSECSMTIGQSEFYARRSDEELSQDFDDHKPETNDVALSTVKWKEVMKISDVKIYFIKREDKNVSRSSLRPTLLVLEQDFSHSTDKIDKPHARITAEVLYGRPIWTRDLTAQSVTVFNTISEAFIFSEREGVYVGLIFSSKTSFSKIFKFSNFLRVNTVFEKEAIRKSATKQPSKVFKIIDDLIGEKGEHFRKDVTRRSLRGMKIARTTISNFKDQPLTPKVYEEPNTTKVFGDMGTLQSVGRILEKSLFENNMKYF